MPKVMTWEELEDRKAQKPNHKEQQVQEIPDAPAPKVPSLNERFLLAHPELENYDFEDDIMLDGVRYNRKCEGGVMTVYSPIAKDYLVSKGFIFLRSEKNE